MDECHKLAKKDRLKIIIYPYISIKNTFSIYHKCGRYAGAE